MRILGFQNPVFNWKKSVLTGGFQKLSVHTRLNLPQLVLLFNRLNHLVMFEVVVLARRSGQLFRELINVFRIVYHHHLAFEVVFLNLLVYSDCRIVNLSELKVFSSCKLPFEV